MGVSSSGWSDERRARHRAAIQKWKPWQKSTGPKTAEGKKRSALNALRHGNYRAVVREFKALLAHHRHWLRLVQAYFEFKIFSPNELLAACYRPPGQGVLGDDSLSAYAILRGKEP